jgi:uncharacterized protein
MALLVNLNHLEVDPVSLEGQIPVNELDIDTRDDIIRLGQPPEYRLQVEKLDGGLLVQGRLALVLDCQCVRCLKRFDYRLEIDPWTAHLPLQGEEAVTVVNDCVDLTPYVREDILLEFPQHPVCERDCRGLRSASVGKSNTSSSIGRSDEESSAWKDLNKLKF